MAPLPQFQRLTGLLLTMVFVTVTLLTALFGDLFILPVGAQATPEYRIPCTVSHNGNWRVVRERKGMNDQQLLDDINNVGRFGHGTRGAQIDFNNNNNNIGARTYGICDDLNLRAARSGTFRSFNDEGLGGWVLKINHPDGQISVYAHMPAGGFDKARLGQPVNEGDIIGRMGCTGACTGIHVHFAVDTSRGITNNWRFKNSVNQDPHAPALQEPSNGATLGGTTVTLRWQDTGDPDNGPRPFRDYRVELWQEGTAWRTFSQWQLPTEWRTTVPGPGVYYWKVISGDSIGASPESSTWRFVVQLVPAAPANLSIAERGRQELALQWADNATNEDGYRVYRWSAPEANWMLLTTVPANSTQYTDSGLSCGTAYRYRVAAYNAHGEQFASNDGLQGQTTQCEAPVPSYKLYLPLLSKN